uniref:SDR family oxidoreductase n=1 Tax=Herbidospora sakaeratensis TaxID=564415 RepID=UPI0012FBABDC|nr:SDR family NAD(P)-dependent oxidoreductase [Herbidospora sakaeratensis]
MARLAARKSRKPSIQGRSRAGGGTAAAAPADVADRDQARQAVGRAVAEFGRLDVVVNNAGLALVGPAEAAPEDEWDRMLAVNVEGLLHVTRAALPHLVGAAADSPRRVADLVTISSTAGRVARAGQAVYSLTKSGVNAFSESLRQELQPKRVRVGVVGPGTVATELSTHLRPGIREAVAGQLGDMELLRPEDVADAVVYMVTRERRVAVNEMLVRAGEQTW